MVRRVVEIKTAPSPITLSSHSYQRVLKQPPVLATIQITNNKNNDCKAESDANQTANDSLNVTRELEVNIELVNNLTDSSNQYLNLNGQQTDKESDEQSDFLSGTSEATSRNGFVRQERMEAFKSIKRRSQRGDQQYEQELSEIFRKMYDRHQRIIHTSSSSMDDSNSNNSSLRRSTSYNTENNVFQI
jgi:hypothetical protein